MIMKKNINMLEPHKPKSTNNHHKIQPFKEREDENNKEREANLRLSGKKKACVGFSKLSLFYYNIWLQWAVRDGSSL